MSVKMNEGFNALHLIIFCACVGACVGLISVGMDWWDADRAPTMTLHVTRVSAAQCSTWTNLHGSPEANDGCRLVGYVYSRKHACKGDEPAWGVSQQRHGRGEQIVFCTDQILSYDAWPPDQKQFPRG